MKKAFALCAIILSTVTFSCNKDEGRSCSTCSSPETSSFEVCKESNGNASVNGEDTGTDYDVYIAGLEEAGVTCGG